MSVTDRLSSGYTVRIATDNELSNPTFLEDVKSFAAKVQIPRRRFVDWLVDGVRDADARLVDDAGNSVEIDFEELERDHIELWFRDWCRRPLPGIAPRLRAESRERVRVVVTMLRMIFPKESSVWGIPMWSLPQTH